MGLANPSSAEGVLLWADKSHAEGLDHGAAGRPLDRYDRTYTSTMPWVKGSAWSTI